MKKSSMTLPLLKTFRTTLWLWTPPTAKLHCSAAPVCPPGITAYGEVHMEKCTSSTGEFATCQYAVEIFNMAQRRIYQHRRKGSQHHPSHHPCTERTRPASSIWANFQQQELVSGLRAFQSSLWMMTFSVVMQWPTLAVVGHYYLFLPSKDNRYIIHCLIWKDTQHPTAINFNYCSSVTLTSKGNSSFSESGDSTIMWKKNKNRAQLLREARILPVLTPGQLLSASRKELIWLRKDGEHHHMG